MQDLIDMVLETLLRSVIWRTTWGLPLSTLIIIGVIVFLILAYRRRSRPRKRSRKRSYKSRFWDK